MGHNPNRVYRAERYVAEIEAIRWRNPNISSVEQLAESEREWVGAINRIPDRLPAWLAGRARSVKAWVDKLGG